MLWSAFVLGLLGGLHCLAMCGPIVLALPFLSGKNKSLNATIYQLGRLLGYGLLGFLVGLIGIGFSWAGIHQAIAIVVGALLCCYALVIGTPFGGLNKNLGWLSLISRKFQQKFIRLFNRFRSKSFVVLGLLNGFLPCGLVYVALSGALLQPHPFDGMLYMVVFGMGTLPVMSSIIVLKNHYRFKPHTILQKLLPLVTFLFGLWILIRGLGLDIPFISPADSHLDLITETQSCDPLN